MTRKTMPKSLAPDVPPTLNQERAINLISRQLERLESNVITLSYKDPEVAAWVNSTLQILHQTFGKPAGNSHDNTRAFEQCRQRVFHSGMNDAYLQKEWVKHQNERAALLRSFIEQLQDAAPPSALFFTSEHILHPEIERVSRRLYSDRHFKQAALEAFIRAIEEVKTRSGSALDGDRLMNEVFGCEGGRIPKIQFNELKNDAGRDEQKGIMYLFKGIVAIRNAKAHSNVLFDNPMRGFEYLTLASLLMRLLENAKVNA